MGSNQRLLILVFTASLYLAFNNKIESVKSPTHVVNRWLGGNLTQSPQGSFAANATWWINCNYNCTLSHQMRFHKMAACVLINWMLLHLAEYEEIMFIGVCFLNVLGIEASSPWPWPRSLRSSKIALSSARGQHYFLNRWNFVGKRQKPRRKFANTFCVFRNWSIGLAKRASPQTEISPITKMWQRSLLFLQFQFLFSVFRLHQ